MSLDVTKLEKVRELPGGIVQARCPACAEGGHDRAGEHLRIYPDGRFGCCVHPKDGEHRKRIWALAGCKLHLPPEKSFGLRLKTPPALPQTRSVKTALADFRTARTPNSQLRACAREDSTANIDIGGDCQEKLKDSETGVRAARSLQTAAVPDGERLPFLTPGGDLVIPFDSPERYHWWRGGQSVAETLQEVRAALAIKKG
jgi:hypothetical protein